MTLALMTTNNIKITTIKVKVKGAVFSQAYSAHAHQSNESSFSLDIDVDFNLQLGATHVDHCHS